MDKQEIKGRTEKVTGKVKEEWGKATGNQETEQEGRQEQVEGEVRKNIGKARESVRDAIKP